MNPKSILLLLSLVPATLIAQSAGMLRPGDSYTNESSETVFYLPRSTVNILLGYMTRCEMDSIRIGLYKELTSEYQQRIFLADSALRISRMESDYWKKQLDLNDDELLESKKANIRLTEERDRMQRSRWYYFLSGVLGTSLMLFLTR